MDTFTIRQITNAKSATSQIVNHAKMIKFVKLALLVSILIQNPTAAKGKMIRCKGNCLKCFDESESCISCPINFYTFQEEVISSSGKENPLSQILGLLFGVQAEKNKFEFKEIKIVTKCLKECPKLYNGKEVVVNEGERKCL
jgi:hypothetical protein